MEGAVLGGKLAAEVVAKRAKGLPLPEIKEIQPHIVEAAAKHEAKDPPGVKGDGAIAFGGGATLGNRKSTCEWYECAMIGMLTVLYYVSL